MPLRGAAGEEPQHYAMYTMRTPRCYPIYLDFAVCMRESKSPMPCADFHHDYFECLHHTEEIARIRQIEEHKKKLNL